MKENRDRFIFIAIGGLYLAINFQTLVFLGLETTWTALVLIGYSLMMFVLCSILAFRSPKSAEKKTKIDSLDELYTKYKKIDD
ncbi:MAG: hypothetical protein ACXAEU_09545 [Candidatus Hodarchaeales archaeon]|jgi:uncharacterized membrane protein